jgi:hypothetical protein
MSHKITSDEEFNRVILGCIRSKVLQRLLIVYWDVLYDINRSTIARKAFERLREKEPHVAFNRENVAYALRPEDIMGIIKVSRRTAWEYIKALREILT